MEKESTDKYINEAPATDISKVFPLLAVVGGIGLGSLMIYAVGFWTALLIVAFITAAAWGFINKLDGPQEIRVPRTRHGVHLLMTVLTGGLWLIPWGLSAARTRRLRHAQIIAELRANRREN